MSQGKQKQNPSKAKRSQNATVDDSKMVMLDDSNMLPPITKGKDHSPNFKIDIPDAIGRTTVDTVGVAESSSPKQLKYDTIGTIANSPEISKRNTFLPMSKQSLGSVPEAGRVGTNHKLNAIHPALDNSNFTGSHLIGNARSKGKGAKLLNSNTSDRKSVV